MEINDLDLSQFDIFTNTNGHKLIINKYEYLNRIYYNNSYIYDININKFYNIYKSSQITVDDFIDIIDDNLYYYLRYFCPETKRFISNMIRIKNNLSIADSNILTDTLLKAIDYPTEIRQNKIFKLIEIQI